MLTSSDIEKRLINNDALFNNIYVVHQNFDILPCDTKHFGTSIDYQDLLEKTENIMKRLIKMKHEKNQDLQNTF